MTDKEMAKHLLNVDAVLGRAEIEMAHAANQRIVYEGVIAGLKQSLRLRALYIESVEAKLRVVIAENNRLKDERNAAVKALNMPETEPVHEVSAFKEHWQSMGQTEARPAYGISTANMQKAIDATGWKLDDPVPFFVPLAQEPSPQADGHVEIDVTPFAQTEAAVSTENYEKVAYDVYLKNVWKTGPYYTLEAWRSMGRPRG